MPTVWTIGYERLLAPELVAEFRPRAPARARRALPAAVAPARMSKTRLGELLGDHGIAYEHRRALGTPADLRHLFHTGRVAEAAQAFRTHVETSAPDALDALAGELTHAPPTALLCLEAEAAVCHRRVLTQALRERRSDLRVVDL